MTKRYIAAAFSLLLMALSGTLRAQDAAVEVDYNKPRKYIVGGVSVEGNSYFSSQQIIQLTGMQPGMEITVPGDDVTGIVRRLWLQRYFEDVSLDIDRVSAKADTAWFKISIKERPRVSRWTFTGVKSGDKKELQERLNLRRGGEFSEYVEKTSIDIIKRFYAEKGFLKAAVKAEVQRDSVVKNAVRVNFAVERGDRVRIKDINFIGNEHVKDFKLARAMKKTKSNKIYNFFNSKKFNEKEYIADKKSVVSAFNEAGYRDARLVRDSVYYIEPKRLAIDLVFEEGDKYYFRDVTWTGNSVYPSEVLADVLQVHKGDVYDVVSMEKRLYGGGKQNEMDISKLYRDNGYLFFNVTPVET
ncbi:MAG: outer membrane protein assembly factor BamA, partial [Bacteroidales bacterium]|nr:outer membrane protein assembly factor BamA [Bacteroidales bacterium]